MSTPDLARHIAGRFDEDDIPYAIGGALALAVWVFQETPLISISTYSSS